MDTKTEPDMRHPKIQNLISQKARREIELSIIESLIEDPAYELTPTDDDYWTSLCDKVAALVQQFRARTEKLEHAAVMLEDVYPDTARSILELLAVAPQKKRSA